MKQGYKKIFWGFLIVLFNINIGPVNILPDFLGYFIIGSGLSVIQGEFENKSLKKANKVAKFLFLYTVIISILHVLGFNEGNIYLYNNIVDIGMSITVSLFSLIMAFYILTGTIDLYYSRNQEIQADSLIKSQKNYTLLYILGLILMSISFNISNEVFITVAAVYLILIQLYFAKIINGIIKTFNEDLIEP